MREFLEIMQVKPPALRAALFEPVGEYSKFWGRITHELTEEQLAASRLRAQSVLYLNQGVPCLGWHLFDGAHPIASAQALLESHELLLGEYQAQHTEQEGEVEFEADREEAEAATVAAAAAANMATIITVRSLDVPGITDPVAEALVPAVVARTLTEQKIGKLQAKLAGLETEILDEDDAELLQGMCEALQSDLHTRIHYGLYIASFLMVTQDELEVRLNKDPRVNGFFTLPNEVERLRAFDQEEARASGVGRHSANWMFN